MSKLIYEKSNILLLFQPYWHFVCLHFIITTSKNMWSNLLPTKYQEGSYESIVWIQQHWGANSTMCHMQKAVNNKANEKPSCKRPSARLQEPRQVNVKRRIESVGHSIYDEKLKVGEIYIYKIMKKVMTSKLANIKPLRSRKSIVKLRLQECYRIACWLTK